MAYSERLPAHFNPLAERASVFLPGALVGSLDLLSMELELAIQDIIAANDGFFMANGPPVTRTIMEGRFGVHFQEDSEHCRVRHVQTYTPVMLNRNGPSQAADADPKYSRKGSTGRGRWGHSDAAQCILHGKSRMKHTKRRLNASTAYG